MKLNKKVYYEFGSYIEQINEHTLKTFISWIAIKNNVQGQFLDLLDTRFINDFDFHTQSNTMAVHGFKQTALGIETCYTNNVYPLNKQS